MRFIQTFDAAANEKLYYEGLNLHPLVQQLLQSRQVMPEEAADFLAPSVQMLYDPFLFTNMQVVVERILQAIAENENVTIYGDYDCDGVSATAILKLCLQQLGLPVNTYLPDRKTEGYGTNQAAFKKIIDDGTTLIITVDCGIRSNEDITYAKNCGVDVIIMDHHECDELPDTPYILNPKLPGQTYPCKNLCGAGVVFKVAQALLGEKALVYLDIAGMATIGDMVPLIGENRVIAALGIKQMRQNPRLGISSLARAARIDSKKMNSGSVSFGLVPRINAAGRLAHANAALELLLSSEEAEAAKLAGELCALNTKRQSMQQSMTQQAIEMIETGVKLADARVLTVASPLWDKGIVGLIASTLVQVFNRPAVVFAEEDGILVGSARSIPGVNIYEALAVCQEQYIRFGGHEMAAGLSVAADDLEEITSKINAYLLETYEDEIFLPTIYYDEPLLAKSVNLRLVEQLSLLEPFGQDNPEPVFWVQNYKVNTVQKLGEGNHLKLQGEGAEVLWFRATKKVQPKTNWNIAANLSVNEFRGIKKPQIVVRNMEEVNVSAAQWADRLKAAYLQVFPKEIKAYYNVIKNIDAYKERHIFIEDALQPYLAEEAKKSAFGTMVFAGSLPGAKLAQNMEFPKSFVLKDNPSKNSAENLVSFMPGTGTLNNYNRFYIMGDFAKLSALKSAYIYFGQDLHMAYGAWAEEYFVDEEALKEYLALLTLYGTAGFAQTREVLVQVAKEKGDSTIGKSWFAMQVLLERQLIAVEKNGKLYSISKTEPNTKQTTDCLFTAVKEIAYKEA